MKAFRFVLKLIICLVFGALLLAGGIGALIALGVLSPGPKPPMRTVPAPQAATPSARPPLKPLPERPCVLQTDGVKHVALFPDAAAAQAFHEVVMAADGLRMLDAPGVFEVGVGTRCALVDLGSRVSKVRIAEGEHAGAVGWITTEWVRSE